MQGFLNVNKPSGISSHKVISILRKITGIKQIGHAGTLDPLASGVLPVAIGKMTKLIDYLPTNKRYITGLEFGKKSDTFDIEGNIEIFNSNPVTKEQVENVLNKFRGEIKQIPPLYSAVHYNGKRLYELARMEKIPCEIPSRIITVDRNEIVEFNEKTQCLKLDITCSKGTYIRSIVNDIGIALNTSAVMYELTRIESGGMRINSSLTLDETLTKQDIEKNLINPINILSLKSFEINQNEYDLIKHGNKIKNRFLIQDEIILTKNNEIIALAYTSADNKFIQPKKLLVTT